MWDWYNRPGSRNRPSTRTVIAILLISGVLVGVVFMTLFTILAPLVFIRAPAG